MKAKAALPDQEILVEMIVAVDLIVVVEIVTIEDVSFYCIHSLWLCRFPAGKICKNRWTKKKTAGQFLVKIHI